MDDQMYLKIKPGETERQFISRVCMSRDTFDMTWDDVRDNCNKELNLHKSESWYRKNYKNGYFTSTRGDERDTILTPDSNEFLERIEKLSDETQTALTEKEENEVVLQQIIDATNELKKERLKLQDIRTSNNAVLRRLSREDTIKEIASEVAGKILHKRGELIPEKIKQVNKSDKSLILTISDWHYGIEINSYWNKYSPEVCLERVNKLYQETVSLCRERNIKEIYLVNLSDLIAGRIHSQIRIESREDVISQILKVQEIVIEFIENLSKEFKIYYYDCLDNHSRIEPDRKESLDVESLARTMFVTLSYVFKNNPNVEICPNEYAMDIISFTCRGFRVAGVHGDRDKPSKVITNISRITDEHFDLILTAHLHHFSCDEQTETLVVSNGSLMGTDTYAEKLRLKSKASQNLIVVSDDNVAEEIRRVILN